MTAALAAYHPDHMPWYGALITLAVLAFAGLPLIATGATLLGKSLSQITRRRREADQQPGDAR